MAEADHAGPRIPNFPNYHTAVTHEAVPTDDAPTTQKALINKTIHTHTHSLHRQWVCAQR